MSRVRASMWTGILGGIAVLLGADPVLASVGAGELDREVGEVREEPYRFEVEQARASDGPGTGLGGRHLLWPTGWTGDPGSLETVNQGAGVQRLRWGLSSRGELEAGAAGWIGDQGYGVLGGRWQVWQDEVRSVSLGLRGRHRWTQLEPGTSDWGVGVDAVVGVRATDDVEWSLGVAGHVPLQQGIDVLDFEGCQTRQEWARGECGAIVEQRRWVPSTGRWAALFVGTRVQWSERVDIKGEMFSGVSQGQFMGLAGLIEDGWSYEEEQRALSDESWGWGLGPLGRLSVAAGVAYRLGPMTVEPSAILSHYDGGARVFPHLRIGARLR